MVLPQIALPIHLKAMVRHQEHLHCGVEFVALSGEQREVLHTWAKRVGTELPPLPGSMGEESLSSVEPLPRPASLGVRVPGHGKKLLAMVAFLAVITAGVTWWHWEKAWQELENRLMGAVVLPRSERLHVPPEIMQQRVLRRVAPMYPEEARSGNIAGVVVMQVAVGRDGNVLSVRPLSGPEILTPAATEAVRWWQFEPYLVKGQAVEVETTLGVEFQP
jgi:TonB family protein